MVWKKHRTRIAKLILVLRSHSSDLYIFLRALFRTLFFVYILYSLSSFLELSTTISTSTILFHNWQIPSLQNSFETFLNATFEEKIVLWQMPFLIEKLKQEISYLKTYNVTVKPDGSCTIKLWPQELMCFINNTYILTQNGDLYEKEMVTLNQEQNLENILIHPSLIEADNIYHYVQPLTTLLQNDYCISISSINTIDVTFKTDTKYIIRCDIKTYDLPSQYTKTMLENMHLQSGLRLKKNEHLIFDMRFSKQIVMHMIKKKGESL